MDPIQIQFQYVDEDMSEAIKAVNLRLRKRGQLLVRPRFGRGLAG